MTLYSQGNLSTVKHRGTVFSFNLKATNAVLGLVEQAIKAPLSSETLDNKLGRLLLQEDQPRFKGFGDRIRTLVCPDGVGIDLCPDYRLLSSAREETRVDFQRAHRMVEAFMKLDRLHGLGTPEKEFQEMYCRFVRLALCGLLEKYLKYQTACVFSRWSGNEYPDRPSFFPEDEISGFIWPTQWRAHRATLFRKRAKWAQRAYDFLQVKRASLPVSRDFVRASLSDHKKVLTQAHKSPVVVPWSLIEESVRKTVAEAIPQRRKPLRLKIYRPSGSGHLEYDQSTDCRMVRNLTRRSGGALAKLGNDLNGCGLTDALIRASSPFLLRMFEARPGEVHSVYVPYDPSDIRDKFLSVRGGLGDEPNIARPVALCEPFKVRVITLGDYRHYWVARSFQRKVHSILRKHWTFQLIGRPCQDESLIEQMLAKGRPDDLLVSGDYKSSTDYLLSRVSDLVMASLCQRLGIPYYSYLRRCLTSHKLMYEDQTLFDQENGQLMGSPLSFLILCLANASVSRLGFEDGLNRRLMDLPMLINGDDVALSMCKAEIERWKGIVTQAGLIPSVGKNYVSDRFIMINSELYDCPRRVDFFGSLVRRPSLLPYANLGLVYGQGRVVTNDEALVGDDEEYDLSSSANDLIRNQSTERGRILLDEWFLHHRHQLSQLPKGMNWFLPKCLGGAGLPTYDEDFSVSDKQLKLAAMLAGDVKAALRYKRCLITTDKLRSFDYESQYYEVLSKGIGVGGELTPDTGLGATLWPLDAISQNMSREEQEILDPKGERMKRFLSGYTALRLQSLRCSLKPMGLRKAIRFTSSERVGFLDTRRITIPTLTVDF